MAGDPSVKRIERDRDRQRVENAPLRSARAGPKPEQKDENRTCKPDAISLKRPEFGEHNQSQYQGRAFHPESANAEDRG